METTTLELVESWRERGAHFRMGFPEPEEDLEVEEVEGPEGPSEASTAHCAVPCLWKQWGIWDLI